MSSVVSSFTARKGHLRFSPIFVPIVSFLSFFFFLSVMFSLILINETVPFLKYSFISHLIETMSYEVETVPHKDETVPHKAETMSYKVETLSYEVETVPLRLKLCYTLL